MVPESGRTCLGLEYFCFQGDGSGQSRRCDRSSPWPRRSSSPGPGPGRARCLDGVVVRMPKAYPIYDATYRRPSRSPARLHRSDLQSAHRRPERHAQVQQPGPLDVRGHDDRGEHARRIPRHLGGQYRLRVPRAPAHARRCSWHIRGEQWSAPSCTRIAARRSKEPATVSSQFKGVSGAAGRPPAFMNSPRRRAGCGPSVTSQQG